jgi:hypothetical protein
MRYVKAFARFWYDFVVGDDWKIAVGVVVALALLLVAVKTHLFGDTGLTLLGAALVVAAFTISLVIDVRSRS